MTITVLGMVLGGAAALAAPDIETSGARPNIVFVLADDLGWADVHCFDPKERAYYETPHIDRLAAEGVKFTEAYTNAANCAPTRAALMSGQYYPNQPIYHVGSPSQGKMIPAENADRLPPEKVTVAEALKEAGYVNGFIGKWHLGDPPEAGPEAQGFDTNVGGYRAGNPRAWEGEYFRPDNNPYIEDADEDEYLTDYLTRKGEAFIEAHQEGPFYLQLSYYTPHSPFQAPERRKEKYEKKEGRGGHHHAAYAAMIESLDRGVGRLMATLDRLGIAENTLFIFYSDNGGAGSYRDIGRSNNGVTDNSPLKSGKGSFYEGGIRVPLIVRWPAVIESATESKEPVIGIDFYPTFLEAAGLSGPEDYVLDGTSLMPLFKDPQASLERRALYWHFPGYPNAKWRTSPVSVIRRGPWKLMKFYETGRLELYNLENDIGEEINLAERQAGQRRELHQELKEWLRAHEAPMPKRRDSRDGN